jgi:hypothetical protein
MCANLGHPFLNIIWTLEAMERASPEGCGLMESWVHVGGRGYLNIFFVNLCPPM